MGRAGRAGRRAGRAGPGNSWPLQAGHYRRADHQGGLGPGWAGPSGPGPGFGPGRAFWAGPAFCRPGIGPGRGLSSGRQSINRAGPSGSGRQFNRPAVTSATGLQGFGPARRQSRARRSGQAGLSLWPGSGTGLGRAGHLGLGRASRRLGRAGPAAGQRASAGHRARPGSGNTGQSLSFRPPGLQARPIINQAQFHQSTNNIINQAFNNLFRLAAASVCGQSAFSAGLSFATITSICQDLCRPINQFRPFPGFSARPGHIRPGQ